MKTHWHKIIALFLLFLFTVGCGAISQIKNEIDKTQQPQVLISKDGKCQLTVPGMWRQESDLNAEAIIQASQRFSELYVMVLPGSKTDFTNETSY